MDPNQQPQVQNTGMGQPLPGLPQPNPSTMPPQVDPRTLPQPPQAVPQPNQVNPYATPNPFLAVPEQQPNPYAAPATATPVQPVMPVMPASAAQPIKIAQKTNPNSTQNALQIAEIRDGIVIMNDGSFRGVVMVKSINFDLMSPREQESVEYAYQGFLNSLYFPIQIFVRSQRVDLQPYIERLDKIRTEHDNMLLALLMDDYIGYIDSLSQQTNIMDKKFYIVIPYFPIIDAQKALAQSKNFFTGLTQLFNSHEDHVVINEGELEKAKAELRNRVQAVLGGLMQCNIQGLPLDTQELIELYYDTYNPDTATRQQLKNFNDLSADVITKGQGVAVNPHLQRELQ